MQTDVESVARSLDIPIRQQDGTTVVLTYADTPANRLFAAYIAKHDRHPLAVRAHLKGNQNGN
jgi:hypothetical protein